MSWKPEKYVIPNIHSHVFSLAWINCHNISINAQNSTSGRSSYEIRMDLKVKKKISNLYKRFLTINSTS